MLVLAFVIAWLWFAAARDVELMRWHDEQVRSGSWERLIQQNAAAIAEEVQP